MEPSTTQVNLTLDPPSTTTTTSHLGCHLSLVALTHYLSSILTRFHAGYFRIGLSLGSQALLWKNLIIDHSSTTNTTINPITHIIFHWLRPAAYTTFWSFSLATLLIMTLIYLLRCIFHLHLVKAEYLHRIGVNYLFAPWASWLLLLQCAPSWARTKPGTVSYQSLWWALVVPMVALDVKIYGQCFTTKGLTRVANPTSHLTVIANLVGSRAAALMGCKETAMILFSLGMVHYLVLFVTLYQRFMSREENLPAMLKPAFFLFFAAPGAASLAWREISGRFDMAAKMLYFLSLFLFTSLACRPTLFKKAMRRFNVTWWAYSFPITILAIVSTEYAKEIQGKTADILMLTLAMLSIIVTFILIFITLFNTNLLLLSDEIDPYFNSTSSVSPEPDQLPTTIQVSSKL